VQFQKIIHIPPSEGIRISWGWVVRGGFCKTPKFKEIYEALLKIPEGWERG